MSRRFLSLLLLAMLLLVIIGVVARGQVEAPLSPQSGTPAALRPVGLFPLDGECFTGRFIAYFDENLVWGADVADRNPIIVTPALPGTFQVDGKHVSFTWRGEGRLAREQYTFQLSPRLRSVSGKAVGSNTPRYTYWTRLLTVRDVAFLREEKGQRIFRASFTADVAPESLATVLTVHDGAKLRVPVSMLDEAPGQHQRFSVSVSAAYPLTIAIAPGLSGARGAGPLAKGFETCFPKRGDLRVEKATWSEINPGQDRIEIQLNEPVAPVALKSHLHMARVDTGEALTFKTETGGVTNRHRFVLTASGTPPAALRLVIDPGLVGTKGHLLKEAWQETLKPRGNTFGIRYHYWTDQGVDGPRLRLQTAVAVPAEMLEKHLTVSPAAGNLEVRGEGYRVYTVEGAWRSGMHYELTVTAGLSRDDGRVVLEKPLKVKLKKTPKTRGARLGHDGKFYFPRRARGPMPLRVRNMDEVTVEAYQLLPSTIAFAVDALRNDYTQHDFTDRYARKIGSETVKITVGTDEETTVPLALEDLLPGDARGVYGLRVSGGRYLSTKIVLWTDLGVLAHWQADSLLLFVHNLDTLAPVAGAKITIRSSKNQVLGEIHTNAEGIARLGAFDETLGTPKVAVVETDGDYTFLELTPRGEDVTGFTASMPPYLEKGYDGYVYCDRNLYRPGETVHARWIVRDTAGKGAAGMPLVFRVTNPKGREIHRETLALTDFGTGGADFVTRPDHLTGAYRLALRLPGEKTDLAWAQVNLEEFVPNRLAVEVKAPDGALPAGVEVPVTVRATNLSGPPAANRKCTARVILSKTDHAFPQWPGYYFGNEEDFTPAVVPLGEVKTDAQGLATFTFKQGLIPSMTTPLKARIRAEVTELGGRSVSSSMERTFFPADILPGLAVDTDDEARTLDLSVAAVTPEGKPAGLPSLQVVLERRTWRYYLRRVNGQDQPGWNMSFEVVSTMEVPLEKGVGHTRVDMANRYGYYRVRVFSDATPMVTTRTFYAGWRSIRLEKEGRPSLVKLTLDKPAYTVGDEVCLRVESPFDGVALVVLQGSGLGKTFRVPVREGVGEARFFVDRAACPNLWAEVTAIHGADADGVETHPYASFAMVNIPVHDPERVLDVALSGVPGETRPGTTVEIQVATHGHDGSPVAAEVTLAAVDEGIHAILDYANPDPTAWFARSRRADYRRAHYYDKVAYDFKASPIGGGMLAKRLGKDTPDVGENWIKPVALWSGVARTDKNGVATVRFTLPEFNGKLRLVAVAANGHATGATHDTFLVRRPFILRTSLPRFALPGDRFTCRALVFNTTDVPRQVRFAWSADGTLGTQAGERALTVPAKGEVSTTADFTALDAVGQGTIHWRADVLDEAGAVLEALREDAPLPVREPAGYQTEHTLTVLDPGEDRTFGNLWFKDDARVDARITVGGAPFLRLRQALMRVVGYPYGCVEQTTSRCLPMYLLRKSGRLVHDVLPEGDTLDHYLAAGIDRLFTMQTGGGGLAFWPGGTDAYPYGSVYACHFLTLVHRDRALPVPEAPFKRLQDYLRRLMNDSVDNSPSGLYLRAYALYVLALDGDLEALESIERFDDLLMPKPGRYLLAAALAINTKDVARVRAYLAERPSQPFQERHTRGVLNSDSRAAAVELLALVEMGASPEDCRDQVRTLEAFLTDAGNKRRHTTQEMAFATTAFGAYLNSLPSGTGRVGGVLVTPEGEQTITGDELVSGEHHGPGTAFTVRNTGETALYVNLSVSGIPLNPVTGALNEGIGISRSYIGPGGAVNDSDGFVQGETYLVDLALRVSRNADHVVVADLLPPGFEIENPRLNADALAGYNLKDSVVPSHLEVRDDRLVAAFNRLARGTHHLYYLVRAVTPGTFQHPAATAECMYAPEVHGRSSSGRITIAGVE